MTDDVHPEVADALRQAHQFQSALDNQVHRTATNSVTATDEAKSVEVTLDGRRWLSGLYIEEGLLRLGAETVQQRVNEALCNAVAAATAADAADGERFVESLAAIAGSLKNSFGLN
ncbi:YbaB/EbfC family nucleoid-associated protein [Mycobacterium sp. 050272]|uniref:YbaB/EbfC family nucleoid-associated protein n=1 Tax=Mycobacterium sp. 050272 TaxID=3142488 RepID=UPI0031984690